MQLSIQEQATLNFYEWERRIRGYYHFDAPVRLEPYYKPFIHKEVNPIHHIDDGRVTGFLDRIGSFIKPKKDDDSIIEPENDYLVYHYTPKRSLVGFSITFPKNTEIQPKLSRELLHLISYTENPVSFEIIGTGSTITIQIVSSPRDCERIQSQIQGYFPSVIIRSLEDVFDIGIKHSSNTVAICDFGLSEECMRPLDSSDTFSIDPLTPIIATLDRIGENEVAIFQMIFQGVQSPWAKDMCIAVSDGQGGSFFADSPEMLKLAQEKTSDPLFAVIMRIAVESGSSEKSQYIASELIHNITTVSRSPYNQLIPLSNEGYAYSHHLDNVFLRCSNRLGFLANARELAHFVHYPNRTVISSKLGFLSGKTKILPQVVINQIYAIGNNEHLGVINEVTLNDEMRLRHTHIIGATGVGKSTLIANMVLEDARQGNGCAIFDPHGDICEDILARIPEQRIKDVIIIAPSDIEYPIGFNLLGATTEAEKIVLSSDLVSAFKRYATSWGDNMTAVLSNAVNTFLEHPDGGTIIELKRFILEDRFRNQYLEKVDDPSLHYYWNNEYPMVRKGIAPLLTRIDTFLRPKTVRYMLAQKDGIDFRACIEQKKIILIKLSQGLIGEENSYLLGSLFLAKFNQVALGRQSLSKSQRHPFYIYLDEFQNFVTPSITSILSGARKYGLGLVLAHQELAQIEDIKVLNSVISNPYTRICFRLGDSDAKKLESGFSYFEQNDLQSLGIGNAIMRVGSSTNDFNIQTRLLPKQNIEVADLIRTKVIEQTHSLYCKERSYIEQLLIDLLPKMEGKVKTKDVVPKSEESTIEPLTTNDDTQQGIEPVLEKEPGAKIPFEQQTKEYLQELEVKERTQKHRSLQEYVRTIGLQRGFKATIEEELPNGKRVDVTLIKDEIRIAIEISVTNTIGYEVQNIQKCLDENYNLIFMISDDEKHLLKIQKQSKEGIDKTSIKKVFFFKSDQLTSYLDATQKKETRPEKRVNGWRVKVNYHPDDVKVDQSSISKKIINALKKKK